MAVITLCRQKRKKVPAGQIIFTTSQNWECPRGVRKADIFLVGGAGGGGDTYYDTSSDGGLITTTVYHGGGGGGGYTATYLNADLVPKSLYSIIVGKGGTMKNDGNPSSFGSYSVDGGKAGESGGHAQRYNPVTGEYESWSYGGNGGSGGGSGGATRDYSGSGGGGGYWEHSTSGIGGIDGSDGEGSINYITSPSTIVDNGGVGQGSTTRAFGELDGELYASGGSGSNETSDPERRRGTGGNGSTTADGNDGIVIVRWKEQ